MAALSGSAPIIGCRDVDTMADFLVDKVGFDCPPGGRFGMEGDEGTVYATMRLDDALLHLQIRRRELWSGPRESIESDAYFYVADVDALHARCVEHGVTIFRDLYDEPYGLRDFAIELPEGQRLVFGTPIE